MTREPQTLVWLPTLHRLIATETGLFNLSERKEIIGFLFSAT